MTPVKSTSAVLQSTTSAPQDAPAPHSELQLLTLERRQGLCGPLYILSSAVAGQHAFSAHWFSAVTRHLNEREVMVLAQVSRRFSSALANDAVLQPLIGRAQNARAHVDRRSAQVSAIPEIVAAEQTADDIGLLMAPMLFLPGVATSTLMGVVFTSGPAQHWVLVAGGTLLALGAMKLVENCRDLRRAGARLRAPDAPPPGVSLAVHEESLRRGLQRARYNVVIAQLDVQNALKARGPGS